ncbi:transposase [Streptomyces sp. NPDC097981]|uniref:transposase n=1 Tax=Streptomyces sp. NPDC097981 TaxID=3155428 RepID=UPI0033191DE8
MTPVVGADPSKHLVPDELWEPAAPLLPSFAARPQGGGTAPCDERAVFTAVVYALTSGCAWRHLPPTFGTSPATVLGGATPGGCRQRRHPPVSGPREHPGNWQERLGPVSNSGSFDLVARSRDATTNRLHHRLPGHDEAGSLLL